MNTEENKLTSTEIDDMLKEMEAYHEPIRQKNDNRKKKPKIRLDRIIATVVIIALVVGVVSVIMHFVGNSKNGAAKTKSDNPLMEEKYPEISDVVKNYMNAFLIEDSEKRLGILAQYVDNLGDIDENDIAQNKYVTNFSDFECYTKNGPYENTYVVYVYYHMEIKNISTTVPSVKTLYVMRDANTGNVYIHNGISNDVAKYIKEASQDKDVQDLFENADKEYEEALASSTRLQEYFGKLQPEETTGETSAKPQTTSSTNNHTTKAADNQTTPVATSNQSQTTPAATANNQTKAAK